MAVNSVRTGVLCNILTHLASVFRVFQVLRILWFSYDMYIGDQLDAKNRKNASSSKTITQSRVVLFFKMLLATVI